MPSHSFERPFLSYYRAQNIQNFYSRRTSHIRVFNNPIKIGAVYQALGRVKYFSDIHHGILSVSHCIIGIFLSFSTFFKRRREGKKTEYCHDIA